MFVNSFYTLLNQHNKKIFDSIYSEFQVSIKEFITK